MRKLKNFKHIFSITVLSLTCLFAAIMSVSSDFTNSVNGFFIYRTGKDIWQDTLYKHHLKISDEIVIIRIDEKTLNTLQASGSDLKMLTIPKSAYGEVIEKLEFARVKGIGFDIVFQNKDEKEGEFARLMEKYNNIAIASFSHNGSDCIADSTGSGITCNGAPRSVYAKIPWGIIDIKNSYNRVSSYDISRTPYQAWKGDIDRLYSLPIQVAQFDPGTLTGLTSLIKTRSKAVLSPYFGLPWAYPSVSFIDVMQMSRSNADDIFHGKYVFIGESGTAIHDEIVSPVSGDKMDGVESHAHFLDGILQNKMLSPVSITMILGSSILLTIVTILFYFFLPNYLAPVFAFSVLAGIVWVSRYLYDIHRVVVDIFPLLIAVCIATFPMTFIYRFFVVDHEKRYIERAFGHYIDPKMVQMINLEQVSLSLGGEQRDLSVFFSDIAGFTTISEKLSPTDLFWLMSLYLSRMTEILKHEGGTLDKYIGDAVMGFFGAPVPQSDHAIRACRTAVAMIRALPELNQEITAKGIQAVSFRVGIASGDVMVGNIGSTNHFNYTVLGDTVNLASRLEATGKEYNMHVIISEGTRYQIGELFALRELDTIAVKGKNEGVRIYELLGLSEDITDRAMYDIYERALTLYRNGEYSAAGKLWESQMDIDPPSKVMVMRCVEILKGDIIVENGVYRMTHK